MQNEVLTYPKFVSACKKIAKQIPSDIKSLYGISRGGFVPAVYISHLTGLPIVARPVKHTLIIDDISDSGKTLLGYQMQGYKIATIYYYKKSLVYPDIWIYEKKSKWIQFPWEVK